MTRFSKQIIVKRWKPILEEYEKILNKVSSRSFVFWSKISVRLIISQIRSSYVIIVNGRKGGNRMIPYFLLSWR